MIDTLLHECIERGIVIKVLGKITASCHISRISTVKVQKLDAPQPLALMVPFPSGEEGGG